MIRTTWLASFLLASPLAVAQEPETAGRIPSGPAVGSPAEPVQVHALVGPRAGQEYDAAQLVSKETGALLFIHELTRNTAPVIRALDELGQEFSVLGFRHQITQLAADRTAAEVRLRAVNGSLRLAEPITVALGGAEGPGAYALDRKATLTLVLFEKGKVVRATGFTDTGPKDVPTIRQWIEELTGPLPANEEELRQVLESRLPREEGALRTRAIELALENHRLRQALKQARESGTAARGMDRRPMRGERRADEAPRENPDRPADAARPAREGGPPNDEQLQGLLRSFIRKTNDDATVDRLFGDIETRAKQSEELTRQSVEMFRLVLSLKDRYGTERAHARAEEFVKRHGRPSPERPREGNEGKR